MTPDDFRALALSLPFAVESGHMGHTDFRVESKIFASFNTAETEGNLKLEPGRLQALVSQRPEVYAAHNGAWGAQGWTRIKLEAATREEVLAALWVSWRLVAPKKRSKVFPETRPAAATLRPARVEEIEVVVDLDDAAGAAFEPLGLTVELPRSHPFRQHERQRWLAAAEAGRLWFACVAEAGDAPVGFAACHWVDGAPHLDQVCVRPEFMGRGLGRLLVAQCIAWSRSGGALWLTTYDHVPWNRPYYEGFGFEVVPEAQCGPELRAILDAQRAVLPAPEERVALRRVGRRIP
jgi:GNAT superfamily N-acetyltransferase/predicted DNA-binding protein (MmcQ/YjbR family)